METLSALILCTNNTFAKFQNKKARKAALEAEVAALKKDKSKIEATLKKKSELLEIAKESIRQGKRMF